jgi:hypothetical protein
MGKHNTLRLTEQQRADLERLTRKGSAAARVQTRARILLLTDRSQGQDRPDHVVADALGCSRTSVVIIRRLYLQEGPEAALYEKARPGAVPKITGDIEAKVTALACSDPPEGHARWTLRLLADRVVELGYVESISHVAIGERLKKTTSSPGAPRRGASARPRPGTSPRWRTC